MKKKTALIEKADRMLKAVRKRIDVAKEIMDVRKFEAEINELGKSLEDNPVEVKKKLVAMAKEIAEIKRQKKRINK